MYWTYDKNSLSDLVPLSDILCGCYASDGFTDFVFSAFRQASSSPVGDSLMQDVSQTGCHIAIVKDLPYYGLFIPAGQGPENLSAPLILMCGDKSAWENNKFLGAFVGMHEAFHVLQNKAGILNVPDIAGVQHGFSDDVVPTMQAESTILTERAADLAASICCLTTAGKEMDYISALTQEQSLEGVLHDCHAAVTTCNLHGDFIEQALQIESIDIHALRYYSRYVSDLPLRARDSFTDAALSIPPCESAGLDRLLQENAMLLKHFIGCWRPAFSAK